MAVSEMEKLAEPPGPRVVPYAIDVLGTPLGASPIAGHTAIIPIRTTRRLWRKRDALYEHWLTNLIVMAEAEPTTSASERTADLNMMKLRRLEGVVEEL